MKILVLLLTAACLHLNARGYSQAITISFKNAPIERVFKSVEQQTTYRFVYSEQVIKASKPVTLELKNASLEDFFTLCFTNQPLTYSIEDKYIVVKITEKANVPALSDVDVKGRVINEQGEGVVATISVKGTTNEVSTDEYGYFELRNVPENASLIITGVSIETMEIKIGGKSNISINVKTKITRLTEVIVNKGYYSTSQKLNTGNVSKVTQETISRQPVSNVLAALEGRVTGLEITQSTGMPGGNFKVRIRGLNSIANGNDPLYVVDGVPFSSTSVSSYNVNGSIINGGSSINNLNPDEIESIEVLKDADATAIYGSRGANGVILITTKKGKPGKTKVDLNVRSGIGQITQTMNLLNTQQYLGMRREGFTNDNRAVTIARAPDLLLWDTTRYTDWQELLIGGTAHYNNAQVTLSGGDINNQFLMGAGYIKETTVLPGDFYEQKGLFRSNFTHSSINKRFSATVSLSYSGISSNLVRSDPTIAALTLPPNAPPVYDSSGNLNWANGTFANPFADLLKQYKAHSENLISTSFIRYQFLPELELSLSAGYTSNQVDETVTVPLASINPANGLTSGNSTFSNSSLTTWVLEPQLKYHRDFSKNNFDFLVGTTFQENKYDLQTINGSRFSSDALLNNIAAASQLTIFATNETQYRYTALFARLSFNSQDKYLINFTGRRDGSSRFGPGKQFANFGAVGSAWIFSNTKFVRKNLSFLSFGKVRLSYGTSGNDQIGDYNYLDAYAPTRVPYQGITGLTPIRLFNPNYGWEENEKFEIALDLGFLNDNIFFSSVYYRNRSSNQLVGYPLPPTTGFSSIQANLPATVENSGVDLGINTLNIKRKNFSWRSSFNITFPRNKLVSYPNISSSSYSNIYVVGKSLYVQKKFQSTGVNPLTGVYEFKNLAGDSSTLFPYYPNDLQPLNDLSPKFYGGLQNTLKYKGWELDFFFHFVKQLGYNYMYSGLFIAPGLQSNQPSFVLNRWQNHGEYSEIQKFTAFAGSLAASSYSYAMYSADNNISDASFIRLKNISLSYQLPIRWIQKIKLATGRIYIQGQNLVTITNYIGMDPETNATGIGSLPPLKVIVGGIQLGF